MTSVAHEPQSEHGPTTPRGPAGIVAETEITGRDVEASWGDWAAAADLADEPAVALLLLAARDTGEDGPDELEGAAFDEARLELLAGRPERALAALARTGLVDLPAGPADDPRTALLAACRAAAGDVQAYRWLLAGLRNTEWAQSWSAAYVVAAAAQARGDLATADEMWWRVVTVHGIRTRQSLQRAAIACVLRRDRDDVGASCAALVEAAGLLDSVPFGTAADPALSLDAARQVGERGDHAGAVLLLRALDRCTASHPTIAAELERQVDRARPRRRSRVVLLAAAVVVVTAVALPAVPGVPLLLGGLGAVVAQLLRNEHGRLTGLDRVASTAFRSLGGVEHRVHAGVAGLHAVGYQRGGYWAAALASLLPSVLLVAVLGSALHGLGGEALSTGLFLGVPAAGFVGAYLGARTLHVRVLRRRREREQATARRGRTRQFDRCACFETPVLTGAFVDTVRDAHLQPVAEDAPFRLAVTERLVAPADLAFCPTTGHLWLQPNRTCGQPLLLRGAVAAGAPVEDVRGANLPTGFYL